MSVLVRPSGPLPSRVYWIRRIAVLAVALVLVTGVAAVLGALSDGASGPDRASQVAATTTDAETSKAASQPASDSADGTAPSTSPTREPAPDRPEAEQVRPDGPCVDSDVLASPIVYRAMAGQRTRILLELTTRESPACRWRASAGTVTVKLTDHTGEEFWSTRQCPSAVPRRDLVLRRTKGVRIAVVWSGRRSDPDCSVNTQWALPGWFRVQSAALAGEPRELLFELRRPVRVVTSAPEPTPTPSAGTSAGGTAEAPDPQESQPTDQPTGSPSGAVEPD